MRIKLKISTQIPKSTFICTIITRQASIINKEIFKRLELA